MIHEYTRLRQGACSTARVLAILGVGALLTGAACRKNTQPGVADTSINPPDVGRTTTNQPEKRSMTRNRKYLDEAEAHVKEFETEREPERLREAYMALENVSLSEEQDRVARAELRESCLSSWLRLLEVQDRFLDPAFNPKDVPPRLIQPPPTSGGVVYPPGADPTLIDDPVARTKYEDAVAANRAKLENYRLQVHLHRLDERLTPRAEAFIRDAYTSDPRDQAELRTALDQIITHPPRKAALSKLLSPARP
jgi:hypothetical protein